MKTNNEITGYSQYKGGFTEAVTTHPEWIDYVDDCVSPFGYIGHECRSNRFDRAVEMFLRGAGLADGGVAVWLTSGTGRHFGDSLYRGMPDAELIESMERNLRSAMSDLRHWGHKADGSRLTEKEATL